MQRVIFACVHNAGRSQMAAAFFNELADPAKAAAVSAGTRPGDRVTRRSSRSWANSVSIGRPSDLRS